MYQLQRGFTLIELMIVVAIIGILSSMAIPTYQDYVIRGQLKESMYLADVAKKAVTIYYQTQQQFPDNNEVANIPQPNHLIGNYVTGVTIEKGAIHVSLGNKINAHVKDKILTLRPAIVTENPTSPIAWLCGYAQPVVGMNAVGENKTDIPISYLEWECR